MQILEQYTEQTPNIPQKITEVKTCSDCCMTYNPDGTLNVIGLLFRQAQTKTVTNIHGTYTYTDCCNCPVTQNMSKEKFAEVLKAIDETE